MTTSVGQAETIARKAGDLLLRMFNPSGSKSSRKSDRSIVTEADMAADQLIHEEILKLDSKANVLSEELQTTLKSTSGSFWVVDPLDGTTNYSLGLHHWGVSLAHFNDGELESAAAYFPLLGEMYTAARGGGAYMNHEPIRARLAQAGQPTSFFSCCSRTLRRYRVDLPYKTRILGSATYTLCSVARGTAVVGFEAEPKIWDIAGGWLIVQEAGGCVEMFNQDQEFLFKAGVNYEKVLMPFLAAATPETLARARTQINPL